MLPAFDQAAAAIFDNAREQRQAILNQAYGEEAGARDLAAVLADYLAPAGAQLLREHLARLRAQRLTAYQGFMDSAKAAREAEHAAACVSHEAACEAQRRVTGKMQAIKEVA